MPSSEIRLVNRAELCADNDVGGHCCAAVVCGFTNKPANKCIVVVGEIFGDVCCRNNCAVLHLCNFDCFFTVFESYVEETNPFCRKRFVCCDCCVFVKCRRAVKPTFKRLACCREVSRNVCIFEFFAVLYSCGFDRFVTVNKFDSMKLCPLCRVRHVGRDCRALVKRNVTNVPALENVSVFREVGRDVCVGNGLSFFNADRLDFAFTVNKFDCVGLRLVFVASNKDCHGQDKNHHNCYCNEKSFLRHFVPP